MHASDEHSPNIMRVEIPDVPARLTPPPAVLPLSLTDSSTAGSTPRRSETALFTRHRKSYHLQLLPAGRQENRMEEIKPKTEHMSTSPSMSPLMRTRKLLAFMKYLPQFSKTSGLSAQNKQKLISTRWTFHLLLLLHRRKRFSLCLEQGKKQYPLCLYSFHHDDLVPFVHINENWRWYQQPSSRWCSHLVGVWLQSNSKHWR